MKKEITELKMDYVHALTRSKNYLTLPKKKKSQKEFDRVLEIFYDLFGNSNEGEIFIKEIAKGDNYPFAIMTSMMLYQLDKEKATYYLKRIIKKNLGESSFYAHQALEELRGSKQKSGPESIIDLGNGQYSVSINMNDL